TSCYRDWSSDVCSSDLVAMSDPLLFSLVQDLEFQTGHRIKQVVATRADILEAIQTGYPDKALMRPTQPPAELITTGTHRGGRTEIGRASCREGGWSAEG